MILITCKILSEVTYVCLIISLLYQADELKREDFKGSKVRLPYLIF